MQYFKKHIAFGVAALISVCTAHASILVIGSPDLKVNQLTKQQVDDIYLGKKAPVSTGEQLQPLDQPTGSAAYQQFYQSLMGWDPGQIGSYWSLQTFSGEGSAPVQVHSDAQAIATVASNQAAIAYIDSNSLKSQGGRVKVLYGDFNGSGSGTHYYPAMGRTISPAIQQHKTQSQPNLQARQQQALARLKPRKTLHYKINANGHLPLHKHPIHKLKRLISAKQGRQYRSIVKQQPLTSKVLYASASVDHSLARAVKQAGLTPSTLPQLETIYAGSLNLEKNAGHGDHFGLLYREYYLHGKRYKQGDIIASIYTHKDKNYSAVHYTYPKNHSGYYTPDGHGVEPLFLKAPLHYRRISSIFTYHRMDPYLHVIRPHLGVDYAAPIGTPVYALGDGKITFCGRDKGYGNAIIIHFNRKYRALYGHLEKFAPHIHSGVYVHRGQTIGYVGSTGWSTGPHLHFSMYVNGIARDPLKLKFPGGKSVPKSYLKPYLAYAKKALNQLNLYSGPELAENN